MAEAVAGLDGTWHVADDNVLRVARAKHAAVALDIHGESGQTVCLGLGEAVDDVG